MADKPSRPLSDKERREQALAQALRANLRRRKAAPAAAARSRDEPDA